MVPGNSVVKDRVAMVAHRARRVRVRLQVAASQKVLQGLTAAGHPRGIHAGALHPQARHNDVCRCVTFAEGAAGTQ